MTPSDAAAPAAFARLVGISRQAVVELQLRGTLTRGATLGRWLREYTGQLRATAAGRAGALTDSRRLLDEARAAEVAARNAERRRTMA
ncbi:MAG: DNA packaging Nu1, partial [Burkholderiales bacterium]|nr:DNA packaging Nu1 [Burkholderiales bacterium]